MTLRQLYYQLVSRDIIPNNQNSYKQISTLVVDARRSGIIDWNMIEDRIRNLRGFYYSPNPRHAIMEAYNNYHIDLWEDQEYYCEVWVEKDALIDVVAKVCSEYYVDFFSCRGFCSDSETYKAGKRMKWKMAQGKKVVLLYLGDHDPSGIDMSRDIPKKLEMFSKSDKIDFRRIALTMEQIEKYNLPPNPAKESDKRYGSYIEKYGNHCWELDALEPSVLMEIIRENIKNVLDISKFLDRKQVEAEHKNKLYEFAESWG